MKGGDFATPSAPPFDDSIPIPVAVAIDDPFPTYATPAAPKPVAEPPLCTTTTTLTTRSVRLQTGLPSSPVRMTCPFCNQTMITRTRGEISGSTVTGVVCLTLFCCPFFWLPLVCDCCKDTIHFCTACGREVGLRSACC